MKIDRSGMSENNIPQIYRGAHIKGAEKEQVTEFVTAQYENGKSIRDIADDLGRSYGSIRRLIQQSDTPLRSRGGSKRKKGRLIDGFQKAAEKSDI